MLRAQKTSGSWRRDSQSAFISLGLPRGLMREIEIEARGMVFQALADGPEEGPLVILLHGLPRNRWEWHHQIPEFAKRGFRVIAPDLRGFCPGARPKEVKDYHLKEYAQDILEIADASGRPGCPFHLMGTSIGANMAWWLAARHSNRIASLVCINIPHPGALAEGRDVLQLEHSGGGRRCGG